MRGEVVMKREEEEVRAKTDASCRGPRLDRFRETFGGFGMTTRVKQIQLHALINLYSLSTIFRRKEIPQLPRL